MAGPSHVDDDRGCLRLVLAVPLTLLTLIAAYFCWTALTITPSGTWDDDAYAGIVLSCVLTIAAPSASSGCAGFWKSPGPGSTGGRRRPLPASGGHGPMPAWPGGYGRSTRGPTAPQDVRGPMPSWRTRTAPRPEARSPSPTT